MALVRRPLKPFARDPVRPFYRYTPCSCNWRAACSAQPRLAAGLAGLPVAGTSLV
jgi:hypothetical protein